MMTSRSLGDRYAQARCAAADASKTEDAAAICYWIDGFPYLPFHYVLGSNDDDDDETTLHANLRAVVDRMVHVIAAQRDRPQVDHPYDGTNNNNNNNNNNSVETNGLLTASDDHVMVVQRVPGGATNRLYKVGDQYLVRLFGGTEGLIDRDEETYYYTRLCCRRQQQPLAPRYYGRFANGRIEGWLHGMRTLHTDELVHYRIPIAQAMGRLHRVNLWDNDHDHGQDNNVDLHATTTAITTNGGVVTATTKAAAPAPSVWIQLDRWLRQAESLQQHHHNSADNKDKDEDDEFRLAEIRADLSRLQEYMTQHFPCAVGFCHNDVLAANILTYDDDNDDYNNNNYNQAEHHHGGGQNNNRRRFSFVQLIDFEYGGWNYCSFDIANHWNEYAGGPPTCTDPDYENKMPTAYQQRHFLRVYRRALLLLLAANNNNNNTANAAGDDDGDNGQQQQRADIMATTDDEQQQHEEDETGDEDDDDDPALLLLWQEVRFFLLVNHLYWGLWAVVQAGGDGTATTTTSSTYDYRRYGRNRIVRYFADRDAVLSSVAPPPAP